MALEFRLHSKEIHQGFIAKNKFSNEIFNSVERSRIEAQGAKKFKGIKSNITKKHLIDLEKNKKSNKKINISEAFKYVTYEKLLETDLGELNNNCRILLKNKL